MLSINPKREEQAAAIPRHHLLTTGYCPPHMTHQQAQELVKKIIRARDRDELQKIISDNISACDGVFFAELEGMVEQFRARNDEASARKLKEVGDFMARLRFMI